MSEQIKSTSRDVAHSLTKGTLGMIPIAGSLASEIFGLIVAPPLEKRKLELIDNVVNRLVELEKKSDFKIENLVENEQFLDTLLQATTHALKTSEKEKIKAFQNAILNTAMGDAPNKAKSQMFLEKLNSFTIWHIKILDFINEPQKWFERAGMSIPVTMMGSIFGVITNAFPELHKDQEFLDIIWNDLRVAGFHNTSDIKTMMSGPGTMQKRTTGIAEEFLRFITERDIK